MSGSLWPHGLQHARLPCQSPTPRVHLTPCPSSWCCHSTISSSVVPFSSTFNLSQHQRLLQWVGSLHQVTKVLEFHLQHQSFQWIFRADFLSDGLVEIFWRLPQVGMINYWLFPVFFPFSGGRMPGWKFQASNHSLLTTVGSLKKQESSRKTSISALLTMPKPLTVWTTIYILENSERDGNTRPPDLPLEK